MKKIIISVLLVLSCVLFGNESEVKKTIISSFKTIASGDFKSYLKFLTEDSEEIEYEGQEEPTTISYKQIERLFNILSGSRISPEDFVWLVQFFHQEKLTPEECKELRTEFLKKSFAEQSHAKLIEMQALLKKEYKRIIDTLCFTNVKINGNNASAVYTAVRYDELSPNDTRQAKFRTSLRKENGNWKISRQIIATEKFSQKRYFVDSAQMLTEALYVMQKTGRFDIVQKQILNHVDIGKIPKELQGLAKRILDNCQQGKIALESKMAVDNDLEIESLGISIRTGSRLGAAIALEDPVSAIWAIYSGVAAFSRATAKYNQKINAVLQQYEYRLKSDMYDLRNRITENAEKYGLDSAQIITFETLEEFERMLPEIRKNKAIIAQYIEKFPYYDRFKCHAVKIQAKNWNKLLELLLLTQNSILTVDHNRLNMCASLGNRLVDFFLLSSNADLAKKTLFIELLQELVEYGLQNGGHSSPVFYFHRGVINSLTSNYGLPKMSEDDIYKDLTMNKPLDSGEFMEYQSLWLASYLAANLDENNEEDKQLLCFLIRIALKNWTPAAVMRYTPFARKRAAQKVYKEMMQKKWEWWIEWGFFNDDIIVKNNSEIALTNITLEVTLYDKSSEQVVWQKELKCQYIAPGQTYRWGDVMSIPNGSRETVSGKAKLRCTEDKVLNLKPIN